MDQLDYGKYGIVSPFVVEREKVESRMNPPLVPQVHCEEFTHLSLMWREGKIPETPSKEIADVKVVFYKMHGDVPLECLDAVWGETYVIARKEETRSGNRIYIKQFLKDPVEASITGREIKDSLEFSASPAFGIALIVIGAIAAALTFILKKPEESLN